MIPPSFSHFVITRYNVFLEGWEWDRSGQSTRDTHWLDHRQKLFSSYCVPSVLAQSVKKFTWLIYFDEKTQNENLDEIRDLVSKIDRVKIIPVNGYHGVMQNIDDQLTRADTEYVITSRLDNDDGLGINYIKTVQDHFIPQDKTIINLLNGHGYHVTAGVVTRLKNMRMNHFGTLIEKRKPEGGHTSIRGFQHGSPPVDFHTIDLDVKNSWLKTFHDRNLKSSAFGYPVFGSRLEQFYGVAPENVQTDFLNTLSYSAWWLLDGAKRKIWQPLFHNRNK